MKSIKKCVHQRPNKSNAEESMHLCKSHEFGISFSHPLLKKCILSFYYCT